MARSRKKTAPADPSRVPVGHALAGFHRDAGVAQEDVGRRLGISRVAVSHYESGETIPMYGQVRRMLSYFGVDLHDLQDTLDHLEGREIARGFSELIEIRQRAAGQPGSIPPGERALEDRRP